MNEKINGIYPTKDVNKAAALMFATGKEPVGHSIDVRNGKREVYFHFENVGLPLKIYDDGEMLVEPIKFSNNRRRLLKKAYRILEGTDEQNERELR